MLLDVRYEVLSEFCSGPASSSPPFMKWIALFDVITGILIIASTVSLWTRAAWPNVLRICLTVFAISCLYEGLMVFLNADRSVSSWIVVLSGPAVLAWVAVSDTAGSAKDGQSHEIDLR